jgi:anti-anti-sigma factor
MFDEATESPLTLEIERSGDAALVRCRGKLVAGVNDVLYDEVKQLMPDFKRIVLDLTDLTHLDSMGLGAIVRLYVSARSAGCNLEFVNLGSRVWKVFAASNLLSVFTIVGENDIRIH